MVLAATSIARTCPPDSGLLDGPIAYEAETDCGPPGPVVLRVNPTCGAQLDGGLAAQLPTFGTVHWKAGKRIDFHGDGPIPGTSVPEGWETTTRCQLRSKRGLDLLEAECLTWVHSRDWKKEREVRRCSGTLRRVQRP